MRALIINGLSFQAAWWMLVLLASWHWLWIVPAFFLVHFFWVLPAGTRTGRELVCLVGCALPGIAFDQLLFWFGLLRPGPFLPAWLLALWLCFAASLPYSLGSFLRRPAPWWLLFSCLGPASYWAGFALTEVAPQRPLLWWLLATGFWSLYLPLAARIWCVLASGQRRPGRFISAPVGRYKGPASH